MSKTIGKFFKIKEELLQRLKKLKEKTGVPENYMINKAIDEYLKKKEDEKDI